MLRSRAPPPELGLRCFCVRIHGLSYVRGPSALRPRTHHLPVIRRLFALDALSSIDELPTILVDSKAGSLRRCFHLDHGPWSVGLCTDPTWETKRHPDNPVVFFDVSIGGHNAGRIVIEASRASRRTLHRRHGLPGCRLALQYARISPLCYIVSHVTGGQRQRRTRRRNLLTVFHLCSSMPTLSLRLQRTSGATALTGDRIIV